MLAFIKNLFSKKEHFNAFAFCQGRDILEQTIPQDISDKQQYIADNVLRALNTLIYDDKFNADYLQHISDLAHSVNAYDDAFQHAVDKALLKFNIAQDLLDHKSTEHSYCDELLFEIEEDEQALWQWDEVNILASYKAVVIGRDVLSGCGCVDKVRNCCVTEEKEKKLAKNRTAYATIPHNKILITTKHLYMKSKLSFDKVPFARLTGCYVEERGYAITTQELKGRMLIFKIHDPQFMHLLINKEYGALHSF